MSLEAFKLIAESWGAELALHALLGGVGVLILLVSILGPASGRRRWSRAGWALLVVLPGVVWAGAWTASWPGRGCGRLMSSGWGGAFYGWSVVVTPACVVAGTVAGVWPALRAGYRVTLHDLMIVFCAPAIVVTVTDAVSI